MLKRLYYKLTIFKYLTRRTISIGLIFVILFNIFLINHSRTQLNETQNVAKEEDEQEVNTNIKKVYSPDLSLTRLNHLFSVLQRNESRLKSIFSKLNVFLFADLIEIIRNKDTVINNDYNEFDTEIKTFLKINNVTNQIEATNNFLKHLQKISNRFTFQTHYRKSIEFRQFEEDEEKPVFMTAANHKYYNPLVETINNLKQFFPNFKLIIYDLGLKEKNLQVVSISFNNSSYLCITYAYIKLIFILKIKSICNCEIRTYDANDEYKNISPHVANMITYSWKPLIIQVKYF